MVLLGFMFVLGGYTMVNKAFHRQKIKGPDIVGKTDFNEPLSILGCIIYVVFGVVGIVLGLHYIIRYR
jgi:hypothetical protein